MRAREDIRGLAGPEKAAILMLALTDDNASRLFSMLADDEIKELSTTMAGLGTVSANLVERLFAEFAEQLSSTGSLIGSFESTERLLGKVLGDERVSAILEEIRGPSGRTMWDKLANVNELVLANYLKNEYPQTAAVVISKIQPAHSARVLACLPENFAMEVIMRMLNMEAVQKDVVDDVEQTLRTEFMANLARTQQRDSHEMMAEIFSSFDRKSEEHFLTMLEERNEESAEKIQSLMFTFEDLGKLDPTGVQTLIRGIGNDVLSLALKGASQSLRDLFFGNISERAGKILREDMESLGPVRISEVDEAQMNMILTAKDMAEKGEIVIPEGKSGGDDLIY